MEKIHFLALAGWLAFYCACSGEECRTGQGSCADDARTLTVCVAGKWETVDCLTEQGRLCEAGACVEPWRYGSPVWSSCPNEPRATPESLRQKADFYEAIARRLHINPQLKWIAEVTLPCDGADCSHPGVAQETATWQQVERWGTGENDGLWNALYLAAEAFRYGATRSGEALENIKLLLEGEQWRMKITGVPGIFTRQYIPPGVAGISCPAELERYIPDAEKDDNKWVRISQSGCVEVVDPDSMTFKVTSHCGLDQFKGFCWLDNVSRDEYAGHMFALGALWMLVDDQQARTTVKELLRQIGNALVDTRLELADWDGRPVEHGRFYAMSLDEFPGFNAAMIMDFIKMIAAATGERKFKDFYDDCLLQKSGHWDCLQRPTELPRPYTDYLDNAGMYVGSGSCLSNWNNISMHMASLHHLIWFERDPQVRAAVQQHLADTFHPPAGTARPLAEQHNAWFDFIYAAQKRLGPGSDGPAYAAVEDAVCMLRQFPARKHHAAVECPAQKCLPVCQDRLGDQIGDYPRQVAERCSREFLWWGNPYDLDGCSEELRRIEPPTDYLLAYWMGRYFGFIGEDW